MHSALVIVEKPKSSVAPHEELWRNLVSRFEDAATREPSIQCLTDGCALVMFSEANGANALAKLLEYASHSKCTYRVLFFKKAPTWLMARV